MPAPKGHKKYGGGIKKGQRQKKTIAKEEAQEITRQIIMSELVPILNALIDKCRDGDVGAIKEALERALGKVKDTLEVDNKIPFQIIQIGKIQKDEKGT